MRKYSTNPHTGKIDVTGDEDTLVSPGIKGLFNSVEGLARWRNSRARSGKASDGTGFGGTDVVIIGTSVTVGSYASTYLYDTWPAVLRNLIQDNHNPYGVQGGMGFVPIQMGDTTWTHDDTPSGQSNRTIWTYDTEANWTQEAGSSSIYGPGMRRTRTATSGNGSRARFVWNGADANAVRKRLQVTDIELLTTNFSGDGTLTWDLLTSDAFVSVGAGGTTGTFNQNSGTNTGIHRGRQASGLTKTDVNGIQIGQASGSTTIRADGAIGYCDDWDCGYRVHNLGLGGSRTDYLGTSGSASRLANVGKWGSTAPGGTAAGATQAGLFILDFLLNDIGSTSTPTIDIATYKASMQSIITDMLACASLPSVLLWVPPCRNDTDTESFYQSYVDELYDLAETNNVALFDSWKMLGKGLHSATVSPNGWSAGDGTHWSDLGNQFWAHMFHRILFSV